MFLSLDCMSTVLSARFLGIGLALICSCGVSLPLRADVVVLANRTPLDVPLRVVSGDQRRAMTLESGRQVVLRVEQPCQLWYDVGETSCVTSWTATPCISLRTTPMAGWS